MRLNLQKFLHDLPADAELRAQRNSDTLVQLLNGNLVANYRKELSGSSVRVYRNGAWGFASAPDAKDSSIHSVLQHAKRNAEFLAAKRSSPGFSLEPGVANEDRDFSTKKARFTQKQLVDFLKCLDAYAGEKFPNLKSKMFQFHGLDMEKSLLTSSGCSSYSMIPRAHIRAQFSLEKDGKTVDLLHTWGGFGQVEDVFEKPESLFQDLDELYEQVRKKQEGVIPEAGVHEVILMPTVAGILAHEAIGHTTEADIVLGGSVAGHNVGKEVASPLVSMVDFASEAFGSRCPVPVYIDDEGTPAKDCVLIEKGVLKGFMHNRETAARFGVKPTGNARAYDFNDEPLIRMRNTAVLPGNSKLSDMIASMDHGYILENPGNGQADSTSEFMFAVNMGYEVRGGKITRAIQNTTISGVAFEMLKTVTMVSDDMHWENSGFCGKKQRMSVGMGGPALKCRVNLGGR